MAVPTGPTYSVAALTNARQEFIDLLDTGVSASKFKLRDLNDVLLGTVTMTDPAGTIDGCGVLTLTGASAGTGVAVGEAVYGEFTDSNDVVHLQLLTESGTAPVEGKVVINSLDIAVGSQITILSAVIG